MASTSMAPSCYILPAASWTQSLDGFYFYDTLLLYTASCLLNTIFRARRRVLGFVWVVLSACTLSAYFLSAFFLSFFLSLFSTSLSGVVRFLLFCPLLPLSCGLYFYGTLLLYTASCLLDTVFRWLLLLWHPPAIYCQLPPGHSL